MGSLLNQYTSGARGPNAKVADPRTAAADAQKEAIKYGSGAAGEELAQVTQEDVQKQGAKILDQLTLAGITKGRDYERAATMKVRGYDPASVEEPFLAKAMKPLGLVDALGATVRFGIADITGMDSKLGTEFDWSDFKDIWGGNVDNIIARHGEEAVGKEGRFSGQHMLNSLGWELPEKEGTVGNWFARNIHGAGALVVEIVTDPLSYLAPGLAATGKVAGVSATNKVAADCRYGRQEPASQEVGVGRFARGG